LEVIYNGSKRLRSKAREFEKFGKQGKVCNATAKDETGNIVLTLWNEDIDKVKTGDTIKIDNGWVSEWQGELQLSTGKFGKLEIVSSGTAETPISGDEKVEEEALTGNSTDAGEHVLTEDEKVEEEILDGSSGDSGEHVLTKDESTEEKDLEELGEEPIVEEEITDDEVRD